MIRMVTIFNSYEAGASTGHLIHRPSDCTILQVSVDAPIYPASDQSWRALMHFVFDYPEYVETANDPTIDMTVSGYLLTLP